MIFPNWYFRNQVHINKGTIPFSLDACWLNKHSLVFTCPFWDLTCILWFDLPLLTHSLYSIHTKPATRSNKIPLSLHKTFPMKTLPLLLWSWLGVVSMVKAVKVGLKGPSMWPFLSQAMPSHWFWSYCSTLECYKGTVSIFKDSNLLASFLKHYSPTPWLTLLLVLLRSGYLKIM